MRLGQPPIRDWGARARVGVCVEGAIQVRVPLIVRAQGRGKRDRGEMIQLFFVFALLGRPRSPEMRKDWDASLWPSPDPAGGSACV